MADAHDALELDRPRVVPGPGIGSDDDRVGARGVRLGGAAEVEKRELRSVADRFGGSRSDDEPVRPLALRRSGRLRVVDLDEDRDPISLRYGLAEPAHRAAC